MQLCRITFVGTGRQAYLLNIPDDGMYLLNERSMRFIKCKKISKPFHTSKISSL